MSMPAALDRYYTRDEVLAFPDDGNRYELVHGELLVTPSPRVSHQLVVSRLISALLPYVERFALGRAFVSPADLSWGEPDLLLQPDVFVVPPEYARAQDWDAIRHLSLCIEVLSPSTSRYDRFTKRRLYQERGVPLYWIIDPVARRAEIWTPPATLPQYEEQQLTWRPSDSVEPFTVELKALLAP
jgi:Uma2 family endonuclease